NLRRRLHIESHVPGNFSRLALPTGSRFSRHSYHPGHRSSSHLRRNSDFALIDRFPPIGPAPSALSLIDPSTIDIARAAHTFRRAALTWRVLSNADRGLFLSNILDQIVQTKHLEIAARQKTAPLESLKE